MHPQVLARDMVVDLRQSTEESVRTLGSPLKLSGTPPNLRHASPTHGQHTAEILADLGLSPAEIAHLQDQGSVKGSPLPHIPDVGRLKWAYRVRVWVPRTMARASRSASSVSGWAV
jgi:hypothetical protein